MLPLELQTNPVYGIITIVRLKPYSASEKETGVTSRGESQMMSVCSTLHVSTTDMLYVECMELKPTSICRRSAKKQCDRMVTVIQTVHTYIYVCVCVCVCLIFDGATKCSQQSDQAMVWKSSGRRRTMARDWSNL